MINTIKTIVQKITGNKAVKKILKVLNLIILGIFSSNRLFSIIYHLIFFPTYSREQQAVLKARFKYYSNLSKSQKSKVDLRRNVHRIEKGLLMKPMRNVFALNYIDDTVKSYINYETQHQKDQKSVDVGELTWGYDVLSSYFENVELNEKLQKLKHQFEATQFRPQKEDIAPNMIPYLRPIGKEAMGYDELLELSIKRRSVRWFVDKPVPRELIDKALMVASQAPSACNRMPFEYKIFDDPEMVKKVAKIPFGAAGYADNIPTIIVLTGKLNYYFSSRDRHVIYIDASLSAMAFMLALETLGLSSSVINWPDFEPVELKMQKTLKLGIDERPVMLIAVGYPDPEGKVAFSQKKSLEVLRSYN
jgi:nitroreductase